MKKATCLMAICVMCVGVGFVSAQSFTEEFEDISLLEGLGWYTQNNSTDAVNATANWGPITPGEMVPRDVGRFQGNTTVFPAYSGAGYIGDNYNATTDSNTISDWLMTPVVSIQDGDTISFWTRCPTGSGWADRLELRMSLNGASTDCGTLPTDLGDFTTLLIEVNPTLAAGGYPEDWTQFSATISGVATPTDGRFALRYYVDNGGPAGSASNYIGVDLMEYMIVPVELQSFSVE